LRLLSSFLTSRIWNCSLQGRDPFSGDCDARWAGQTMTPAWRRLAGTRPVFRGLRPGPPEPGPARDKATCKDETRFQGIATLSPAISSTISRKPCKDETRFQGIATGVSPGLGRAGSPGLARTRPVFRGLRHAAQPGVGLIEVKSKTLQRRDPFSGDCELSDGSTTRMGRVCLAGTRPVFRGLRPDPSCSQIGRRFRIRL